MWKRKTADSRAQGYREVTEAPKLTASKASVIMRKVRIRRRINPSAASPTAFANSSIVSISPTQRKQEGVAEDAPPLRGRTVAQLEPIAEETTAAKSSSYYITDSRNTASTCYSSAELHEINTEEVFTSSERSAKATAGSRGSSSSTGEWNEPNAKLETFRITPMTASLFSNAQPSSSGQDIQQWVPARDCSGCDRGVGNFLHDDPVIRSFLSDSENDSSTLCKSISFALPTRDTDETIKETSSPVVVKESAKNPLVLRDIKFRKAQDGDQRTLASNKAVFSSLSDMAASASVAETSCTVEPSSSRQPNASSTSIDASFSYSCNQIDLTSLAGSNHSTASQQVQRVGQVKSQWREKELNYASKESITKDAQLILEVIQANNKQQQQQLNGIVEPASEGNKTAHVSINLMESETREQNKPQHESLPDKIVEEKEAPDIVPAGVHTSPPAPKQEAPQQQDSGGTTVATDLPNKTDQAPNSGCNPLLSWRANYLERSRSDIATDDVQNAILRSRLRLRQLLRLGSSNGGGCGSNRCDSFFSPVSCPNSSQSGRCGGGPCCCSCCQPQPCCSTGCCHCRQHKQPASCCCCNSRHITCTTFSSCPSHGCCESGARRCNSSCSTSCCRFCCGGSAPTPGRGCCSSKAACCRRYANPPNSLSGAEAWPLQRQQQQQYQQQHQMLPVNKNFNSRFRPSWETNITGPQSSSNMTAARPAAAVTWLPEPGTATKFGASEKLLTY